MPATGGSIESITLDGRTFAVAADSDSPRGLGGFNNEVQANGDGTARLIKVREPWMIDDLSIEIDDQNGDQEFIVGLQGRNGFFPVTASYASGAIWQGSGQIIGEVRFSNANTTASIGLSGSGALTQQ